MMMKLEKIKSSNGLRYDGLEDGFYEYKIKPSGDSPLQLDVAAFSGAGELKPGLGESLFQQIISEVNGTESGFIPGHYKGSDGLSLQGCIVKQEDETFVLLITCGEFQPGRYKIYFEGCWKITGE